MAYNKFTLEKVIDLFSVEIKAVPNIFDTPVQKTEESEILKLILKRNMPLSRAIPTEKALSELLISPVLVELKEIKSTIGVFSGVEFNVDSSQGLNGRCDFIITGNDSQFVLNAPILTVVEAKKGLIEEGYGQCVAEMIAAQIFNQRKGIDRKVIYGVVTSGLHWKFLSLQNKTVCIENRELGIDNVEKILGVLLKMME
ncbi:MAG: hypothetical protein U5M51_13770 [Emticicia sp.]|nr:hypothetical protein [Emticicia sp.]